MGMTYGLCQNKGLNNPVALSHLSTRRSSTVPNSPPRNFIVRLLWAARRGDGRAARKRV